MQPHVISLAYEGNPITIQDDGWFNATQPAKYFQKDPTAWLRQRDTAEYLAALCKRAGNSGFLTEFNKIKDLDGSSPKSRHKLLELVKRTGFVRTKSGSPENGGGTWLHPKLAVRFAQWLNIDFALWCDERIDEIVREAADGNGAEYLPTYHALHQRVDTLAANSSNKKFVHVNLNKLINSTVGIQSGERHGLPLPRKSLLIVAQAAATQAMEAANDHHDGYQLAKAAMGTIRPVAQQLAGQTILNLR